LYHSTLGSRVTKKKKKCRGAGVQGVAHTVDRLGFARPAPHVSPPPLDVEHDPARERDRPLPCEWIDYKTSMITDEDPLRGLLLHWDLPEVSLTHCTFLKTGDGGANVGGGCSHTY